MTDLKLKSLCQEVISIVEHVAAFIQDQSKIITDKDIELKSLNSLVSYVDQEAEKKLVSALSALISNSGFYTEEESTFKNHKKEYTWIIDPLDGTTN